jgi:phage repressor protein C with HTH and peptisase S24 domain
MLYLRRVEGNSMKPTLRKGQLVVISMVRRFKVGDVVVAFMDRREVVKRITQMKDGSVFLEGDNKRESSDSNTHGWLPDRQILGRVIFPFVAKRSK